MKMYSISTIGKNYLNEPVQLFMDFTAAHTHVAKIYKRHRHKYWGVVESFEEFLKNNFKLSVITLKDVQHMDWFLANKEE